MVYEIQGVIEAIMPTITKTSRDGQSTFYRREIVLNCTRYDNGDEYVNFPKLEFSGDKCAQLDNFMVGQRVKIGFYLKGVRYTDASGVMKYFTTIGASNITLIPQKENVRPQPLQQPQPQPQAPVQQAPVQQAPPQQLTSPQYQQQQYQQRNQDLPF